MSTIYTLLSTDLINDTFDDINTNFANLNTDKAEDSAVVHDTGNETITGVKTFSSSPIVPTPTTATQAVNKEYADYTPDFYKYSIVTSVASWNLTVALKNYEGNDPTPSKPVKIQIWDVVRSITSALSVVANSWTSYLNLGNAELATKETDLFPYLQWNTTTSAVNILASRIPYAGSMADLTNSNTGEKGAIGIINYNSTNSVVNIWRFAATLSAGAGYTWSVPTFTSSNLIQRPIYETRKLQYSSTLTWFSVVTINTGYYKLIGNEVHILSNEYNWTSNATGFTFTTPFSTIATVTRFYSTNGYDNWAAIANTVIEIIANNSVHSAFKSFPAGWWNASWLKAIYLPVIIYTI